MNVLIATNSPDNPYLQLRTDALENEGIKTTSVDFPPVFPLTSKGVLSDDIDIVHLDWIYQFYITTPTSIKQINTLMTAMRAVIFILDLFIVSLSSTGMVWTIHDINDYKEKRQRSERVVYEALFVFSDELVTKCDSACQILSEKYLLIEKDDFHVIRDGNYIDVYPDEITRKEAREALSVDEESFVFLFFGLIKEYKGVDLLIDAFHKSDLNEAELWIVGNPAEDSLETELSKKVTDDDNITLKLEYVPAEDVQKYMNMSDILVLPFREILNSGSVYLGMTFGLPIIAPEIGCIPATVSSSNEELLYDGSSSNLRGTMTNAYSRTDVQDIARANRQQGRAYDWKTPAQQLAKLYERA